MSGAELTRRLLAFARQQPLQPAPVALNGLVEGMVKLLARTLGKDIEIALDLAADPWPVLADAAQLNPPGQSRDQRPRRDAQGRPAADRHGQPASGCRLCRGAWRGRARRLCHGRGDRYRHRHGARDPRARVRAVLHHQGAGSRSTGKGTGLSMVFGFIKQSAGHINLYSEAESARPSGSTCRAPMPAIPCPRRRRRLLCPPAARRSWWSRTIRRCAAW